MTNVSANYMFLEKTIFTVHLSQDFLKSIDVNELDDLVESTVVLKPGDVRSLLFLVKPINDAYKIKNTSDIELGSFELRWRNYFGAVGVLKFENWVASKS